MPTLLDGWKSDDWSAIPGRKASSLLNRPDVLTLLRESPQADTAQDASRKHTAGTDGS